MQLNLAWKLLAVLDPIGSSLLVVELSYFKLNLTEALSASERERERSSNRITTDRQGR